MVQLITKVVNFGQFLAMCPYSSHRKQRFLPLDLDVSKSMRTSILPNIVVGCEFVILSGEIETQLEKRALLFLLLFSVFFSLSPSRTHSLSHRKIHTHTNTHHALVLLV